MACVDVGIGFGVLAKYSIAFPVASLFTALVSLPSQRHHLRTRWFWYGLTVAIMMALPNLLWLATHHFITLQMEHFIHLRDVHEGRAESYYGDQLRFTLFAFPLALAGLIWLLSSSRFRLLACFWIGPFLLFALAKGRGYYLIPAYTVLYAAGAVPFQNLCSKAKGWAFLLEFLLVIALLANLAIVSYMRLSLWRGGSSRWVAQVSSNSDLADEVGWPEFVTQVSKVYDSLSPADREHARIVANNYGEAGALDLYGPDDQLPPVMSRTNSFFYQTFPSEGLPDVVIITGSSLAHERRNFASCTAAGTVQLPFGVMNEESAEHPEILVCRHPLRPWQQLWGQKPQFG